MTIRTVLLASSLVAAACSSSLEPADGGGAGTTGAGAVAGTGTGGSAGQGGSGGLAACLNPSFSPGAFVEDAAGMQQRTSFTAAVTVVSSEDCASGICGSHTDAWRIVLAEAGGRRWTLYAYYSGLPADIVDVGEALDLKVAHWEVQTGVGSASFSSTVLSRAGTAVIFDVSEADDLVPYGIAVVASSAAGVWMGTSGYTSAGAEVTYGAETRSVAPQQTVSIGKLSFFHGGFDNWVQGDWVPYTESMAGFTVR